MLPAHRPAALLAVALLWTSGCRPAPPDWIPVLEETSTSFLETALSRSRERVQAAREAVPSAPDEAEELLASAERELRGLERVYLPLLEARNRAYNAYRHHHLARDAEALHELESIEETVLRLSGETEGTLLVELEKLEELVADARVETEAGSEAADERLRRLAEALAHFVSRADLFL